MSNKIEVFSAAYLPFDKDLGDHRPVAVDISMNSLIGTNRPKVQPHRARRLNSSVKRTRQACVDKLEESYRRKNVLARLEAMEKQADFLARKEVSEMLEILDKEMTELMLSSEKECSKLYAGHYEFSPDIQIWISQCHAFQQLIRERQVKCKNRGNLKHLAKRCNIPDPMSYSIQELVSQYRLCRSRSKSLMASSPWMRKQFLSTKLEDA